MILKRLVNVRFAGFILKVRGAGLSVVKYKETCLSFFEYKYNKTGPIYFVNYVRILMCSLKGWSLTKQSFLPLSWLDKP